jgi:hypothetical protein
MKFLSLIFTLLLPALALAQGGSGSHGGDSIAFEFIQIAESLKEEISLLRDDDILQASPLFEVSLLKQAIKETRVVSTEKELSYKEQPIGAINHTDESPYRIQVQSGKWANYSLSQKEALSLHEYLGVVEKLLPGAGEWDHDRVSRKLLELVREKRDAFRVAGLQWNLS